MLRLKDSTGVSCFKYLLNNLDHPANPGSGLVDMSPEDFSIFVLSKEPLKSMTLSCVIASCLNLFGTKGNSPSYFRPSMHCVRLRMYPKLFFINDDRSPSSSF